MMYWSRNSLISVGLGIDLLEDAFFVDEVDSLRDNSDCAALSMYDMQSVHNASPGIISTTGVDTESVAPHMAHLNPFPELFFAIIVQLLFLVDEDFINHSVFFGLCCDHPVVAVAVGCHFLHAHAAMV